MITVVYNCVDTIEETILSVIKQSAIANLEYIVIDGNSSDGTQAIIEKYKSSISHYISESDSGLYDAMNKGMEIASGDFCLFLNAGDVFYRSDTMESYINSIDELDMVYFATAVLTDRTTLYKLVPQDDSNIDKWLEEGGLPNHQSMLFPRVFYSTEKYDLKFKICSDDDFKIRVLQQCQYKHIELWTILFEMGGISSSFHSWEHVKRRIYEMNKLQKKHPLSSNSNRINFYKYSIKLVVIWGLTIFFGFRKSFDSFFNKYEKINSENVKLFKSNIQKTC